MLVGVQDSWWLLRFTSSSLTTLTHHLLTMGEQSGEERSGAEYLAQLLKDKKQIQAFPNVFIHLERLLDDGK